MCGRCCFRSNVFVLRRGACVGIRHHAELIACRCRRSSDGARRGAMKPPPPSPSGGFFVASSSGRWRRPRRCRKKFAQSCAIRVVHRETIRRRRRRARRSGCHVPVGVLSLKQYNDLSNRCASLSSMHRCKPRRCLFSAFRYVRVGAPWFAFAALQRVRSATRCSVCACRGAKKKSRGC